MTALDLLLRRTDKNPECTIGELYVGGRFECYTLEDAARPDGVKVYGETAIPPGDYAVDITMSPRFKRLLPLLINVQGFIGVRIHPGNTAADTDGCVLVGRTKGVNRIGESRLAFDALFAKLQAARKAGHAIKLTIQ
jgi:hypothetical protein